MLLFQLFQRRKFYQGAHRGRLEYPEKKATKKDFNPDDSFEHFIYPSPLHSLFPFLCS